MDTPFDADAPTDAATYTLTVDEDGAPSTGACPDGLSEPDELLEEAAVIDLDTPLSRAFCTDGDRDSVAIDAVAGQSYRIETQGLAPDVDTVLELFSPLGDYLDSNDDGDGSTPDSALTFVAEETGRYVVQAFDLGAAQSDDATYELLLTIAAVEAPCADAALEPDDTLDDARNVAVDAAPAARAFCTAYDEDWIAFPAVAGTTYRIETTDLDLADTFLVVVGPNGNDVAENDDASDDTLASRVDYRATTTGVHYVLAGELDGFSGEGYGYSLSVVRPPVVTALAPAANATAVAVASNVTATFSEAVSGVTSSTFRLKHAVTGAAVSATVTRNAATNQWILNPAANLAADTKYTATVTGGPAAIRDATGTTLTTTSWTFLTGAAPTVTTRAPAVNGTAVSGVSNVTATFSEAVTGVSASTFRLKNAATGASISAAVTRNGTTNQWVLNPGVTLTADTRYTATLTGGTSAVRDTAGNPLATTSWTFLTGAAPVLTAKVPAANATGVSRTANVTASFNEVMTGITTATFRLRNAATGASINGVVSRNGTTNQWILNPGVTLAGNTRYTASVFGATTGIRDRAGNPVASATWTFTTRS